MEETKKTQSKLAKRRLCVFCGSRHGRDPKYSHLVQKLGEEMAARDIELVYGGGNVGLMGELADAVLKAKGRVYGVIPQFLVEWEVAHRNITKLEIVDSMHERKQKMYEYSDGLVALPGGLGTLDEICEIVTWAQLKRHRRPCFVLNTFGFYTHFLQHLQHICAEDFLSQEHLGLLQEVTSVEDLLKHFIKQT